MGYAQDHLKRTHHHPGIRQQGEAASLSHSGIAASSHILQLQKDMGNRAVAQFIKNRTAIPGHSSVLSGSGTIQMKCGTVPESDETAVLKSWSPEENIEIKMSEAEPQSAADRMWVLKLFNGKEEKGTISILYYKNEQKLKPDNLQVYDARGAGYGNVLAKYAVEAMNLPEIKQHCGEAGKVELNLMNPISAHISIKELNLKLNGGDPMDAAAFGIAEAASKEVKGKKGGYDVTKFPGFWGRLVYLAKNNGVEFSHKLGLMNSETDFTDDLMKGMLLSCANANIKAVAGFGLNVTAPLPRS